MTNIEIIKTLVNVIEPQSVQDEAIKQAILALLDKEEPASVEVKPAKTKTETASVSTRKPGRKSTIDWGKAEACYNAGWSIPKIADELKCSDQTIRNHFKALEV